MIEVRTNVVRRSKTVPSNNFVGLPPGGNNYDVPIRLNGAVVWGPQSGGGGGGGSTNLTITFSTTTAIIANSAGTGVTISAATASQAGLMSNAMFVKLRDIATGATANASDAFLLNRDNHSGAQAISTITGLQTALDYFADQLSNKVTVVVGKQLSTEDYSTADKNKLTNIAPNATANATDAQLRDRSLHTGQQAISTVANLQTTLDSKLNSSLVGVAGGLVPLDGSALIPSVYLPSFVDDVLEFANLGAFPGAGEAGKIYVALDSNKTYRWGGSSYTFITSGAVDSVAGKTGVVTLVKGDVGLGNVDNTSDASKPVSTAQAAAIALKENEIAAGSAGQYFAWDKTWKILNAAAIGLTSGDITTALGFTPYSTANPSGYISGNQTINITGDATGSGTTSITLSIGNNKVTNTMLAQVATKTFKGRTSASTGNLEDLSASQATAMLDTFTYSAKGLVPAPGGSGSTKFLREDGSWQTPPGGGGAVASVQFSTDNSIIATELVGGKPMLRVLTTSGDIDHLQASIARKHVALWKPSGNSSTQPGIFGVTGYSVSGTATARNVATTNMVTRSRRIGWVSAATAGSMATVRIGAAQYTIGAGSGVGGFFKCIRFACSDAATVSGARQFVGMGPAASQTNVDPSTLTNSIGVGHGASDTNLKIYYGGSSAQTPIDLGANFPANTLSADLYELILYSDSYSTNTVKYRVTRVNTGDVAEGTLTGTAGVALPGDTTFMAMTNAWRSNNATALAVGLDIISDYIETDN